MVLGFSACHCEEPIIYPAIDHTLNGVDTRINFFLPGSVHVSFIKYCIVRSTVDKYSCYSWWSSHPILLPINRPTLNV